jgi:hypothetical protein
MPPFSGAANLTATDQPRMGCPNSEVRGVVPGQLARSRVLELVASRLPGSRERGVWSAVEEWRQSRKGRTVGLFHGGREKLAGAGTGGHGADVPGGGLNLGLDVGAARRATSLCRLRRRSDVKRGQNGGRIPFRMQGRPERPSVKGKRWAS